MVLSIFNYRQSNTWLGNYDTPELVEENYDTSELVEEIYDTSELVEENYDKKTMGCKNNKKSMERYMNF